MIAFNAIIIQVKWPKEIVYIQNKFVIFPNQANAIIYAKSVQR